ncbi:uncharacterized protein DUF1788 [Melghirimyces profundicolus]|uniref:Uncharacterized protein DUF1788 n=1 Tax=Melghirimyces profundicolus TaxID=1242148 RepID=A0A2T6B9E6_9BACL|nr:BREX protein BrxB domain-containing protein [Melghirimyces profundicolus]PTX52700.1 uncharacterized protein DUF1788 [Melghirimyces profundicolus]
MTAKLQQKLDAFYQEVQKEEFLNKRGLANEVPYFIFDYPPGEELIVRAAVDRYVQRLPIKVLHVNMFELMMEQFSEVGVDSLLELEEEEGTDELFDAMSPSLESSVLARVIAERSVGKQILFITRMGSVYPLIRTNSILYNLGDLKVEVPVVVFYPGSYREQGLMMFNRFPTQHYYRAFSIKG